jgi:hypothetical protein
MKSSFTALIGALLSMVFLPEIAPSATVPNEFFALPPRGFVSSAPAKNWQHGILTGNGTMGESLG